MASQNLQIGSSGNAVKQLQQQLGISADGIYGPQTAAAVKAYQAKNGLSSDGIVGPQTLASLSNSSQQANTTATPALQSTGDPTYDAIQNQLHQLIQSNLAAGLTIDPNNTITPALASQFLQEAKTQLAPEFQQYLTSNISDINASLGKLQKSYEQQYGNSETQFQQNLLGERNQAASNGTAFSGQRGLVEQQDLATQNRNLAALNANAKSDIGNELRLGGSTIGQGIAGLNGDQSNFNIPILQNKQATLDGFNGGSVDTGQMAYDYNPSNYPTSTLGSQYLNETGGTQANLQSNYLTQVGTNYGNTPNLQNLNNTNNTISPIPGSTSYQNLNTPTLS